MSDLLFASPNIPSLLPRRLRLPVNTVMDIERDSSNGTAQPRPRRTGRLLLLPDQPAPAGPLGAPHSRHLEVDSQLRPQGLFSQVLEDSVFFACRHSLINALLGTHSLKSLFERGTVD